MLIVLIGKTATGKTTIQSKLVDNGLKKCITYTTRPMREGEKNHETYHFISSREFLDKIEEGFFTEYKIYETKEGIWFYGSKLSSNSDDEVIILTPDGYRDIEEKVKDKISILIDSNNQDQYERLTNRGDDKEEVIRRLRHDNIDFLNCESEVDYVVTNDLNTDLDQIINNIMKIIIHEKGGKENRKI